MKQRTALLLSFILGSFASLHAAVLERDLGQGLKFFRIHELPADLPSTEKAGKPLPCVVDVRYARGDVESAKAFEAWLRFRSQPRVPIFVLANSGTAIDLLRVLAQREVGGGVVLIGVPSRNLKPDVTLKLDFGNERLAYDAMEKGASLPSLLTDNPGKARNDEASLSRDRLAEASAEAVSKDGPPPVVDVALQRAVHLHRSLVALKKI